jgi:hypothetical protein
MPREPRSLALEPSPGPPQRLHRAHRKLCEVAEVLRLREGSGRCCSCRRCCHSLRQCETLSKRSKRNNAEEAQKFTPAVIVGEVFCSAESFEVVQIYVQLSCAGFAGWTNAILSGTHKHSPGRPICAVRCRGNSAAVAELSRCAASRESPPHCRHTGRSCCT